VSFNFCSVISTIRLYFYGCVYHFKSLCFKYCSRKFEGLFFEEYFSRSHRPSMVMHTKTKTCDTNSQARAWELEKQYSDDVGEEFLKCNNADEIGAKEGVS